MVTIALTKDIEGPLTEQARKRGMTPEQLALETLREIFAKPLLQERQEEGTLFDFLSGYIGTVEGSGEDVSRIGSQLFTDSLVEKKRRGHL